MPTCYQCGAEVPIMEPPRYDVFGPDPSAGTFCATCFAETVTGKFLAENAVPDTLDPEEG